jgi:hypothetical protein
VIIKRLKHLHIFMQADSGASTPETVKPREVLDEYVDPEDASSPFRPSWLYGYNSK